MAGDPAKGIPPCQGCHGVDASGHADPLRTDRDGHAPYASYPALRGQQSIYLQIKLAEYRDGKMDDSTTDFVMSGIGKRLDDDSIQALSAWLSSLPPAQSRGPGENNGVIRARHAAQATRAHTVLTRARAIVGAPVAAGRGARSTSGM